MCPSRQVPLRVPPLAMAVRSLVARVALRPRVSAGTLARSMIEAREVMSVLVAACPSYGPRWDGYRSDPTFDDTLLYVHLGDFADHLVSLLATGRDSELESAL